MVACVVETHPQRPVPPPIWRGASDLSGNIGDPCSGTYRRSINAIVKDATTFAKRRGFQRAFDELFYGQSVVTSHRAQDGTRYQIVGDADGVKILSAFVPRPDPEDYFDHSGFPDDEFDRAASTTVAGTNPYEPWSENIGSSPVGGDWETTGDVSEGYLTLRKLSSNGTSVGTLDKLSLAPTPFYVVVMELDLTDFSMTGTGNNDNVLQFNIGMPDLFYKNATIYNTRLFMAEALRFHPTNGAFWSNYSQHNFWSGMDVQLNWAFRTGTTGPYVSVVSSALMSDLRAGQTPRAIKGYMVPDNGQTRSKIYNYASVAGEVQTKHILEFGREAVLVPGSPDPAFRQRVRLWTDRSFEEIDFARDTPAVDLQLGPAPDYVIRVNSEVTANGRTYYNVLPFGDVNPQLGAFGGYGKITRAGGVDNTIKIRFMRVSHNFR